MHIIEVFLGTFLFISLTEAKAAVNPAEWKEKCEIVKEEVCTTIDEQKCDKDCGGEPKIDCYMEEREFCFNVDQTKCTTVDETLCLPDTKVQECKMHDIKISETTCHDSKDKSAWVDIDSVECTETPEHKCITTYDARCDQTFEHICKPEVKEAAWKTTEVKVNEVDCHSKEETRCKTIFTQVCKPGWKEPEPGWKEPEPEWKEPEPEWKGGKEEGSWGNKKGGKYCRTLELQHCKYIHFKKCDDVPFGEPGWEKIQKECNKATRLDCTMKPTKICFDFPDLECQKESQEICMSFPVQTCKTKPKMYEIRIPGHTEIKPNCKKVPITNCHVVPKKKCIELIHTKCKPTSKRVEISVPSQDCRTDWKTISIPECHTKQGPKQCLHIPIMKCRTINEKQCIKIPIQKCEVTKPKPDWKDTSDWKECKSNCRIVPRKVCKMVEREVCPEPEWKEKEPEWKEKGKKS